MIITLHPNLFHCFQALDFWSGRERRLIGREGGPSLALSFCLDPLGTFHTFYMYQDVQTGRQCCCHCVTASLGPLGFSVDMDRHELVQTLLSVTKLALISLVGVLIGAPFFLGSHGPEPSICQQRPFYSVRHFCYQKSRNEFQMEEITEFLLLVEDICCPFKRDQ